jgi:hypothetical protein
MVIFTIVIIKNGNIHHRYYLKMVILTIDIIKMVIFAIVIIKNGNIHHRIIKNGNIHKRYDQKW